MTLRYSYSFKPSNRVVSLIYGLGMITDLLYEVTTPYVYGVMGPLWLYLCAHVCYKVLTKITNGIHARSDLFVTYPGGVRPSGRSTKWMSDIRLNEPDDGKVGSRGSTWESRFSWEQNSRTRLGPFWDPFGTHPPLEDPSGTPYRRMKESSPTPIL